MFKLFVQFIVPLIKGMVVVLIMAGTYVIEKDNYIIYL